MHEVPQQGSPWFPQLWQMLLLPHSRLSWQGPTSQQGCPLCPHWSLHAVTSQYNPAALGHDWWGQQACPAYLPQLSLQMPLLQNMPGLQVLLGVQQGSPTLEPHIENEPWLPDARQFTSLP